MVFHVLNRGVGRMQLFRKPQDYQAFERAVEKTLESCPLRICSYVLMPNHWHFVVWPQREGDLAAFMQKLTITHVRNWQVHRRRVGEGHVYQGRYKSFPVETDAYFYDVVRYVEANPLRARLVTAPERWQWGSLWRREQGEAALVEWLSDWPLPMPRGWLQRVAKLHPKSELESIRRSVTRGQPYGSQPWTTRVAEKLGLESTLRHRGRPRKTPKPSPDSNN
jgi:putative transposase